VGWWFGGRASLLPFLPREQAQLFQLAFVVSRWEERARQQLWGLSSWEA